jgi:hypothetical protein
LRRDQYRVYSTNRDLRGHLLAVTYVVGEIGAVAVKKHDHDRRAFGVETWRNVQQYAVVTKSLRLPKNIAAEIDVAPMALSPRIQKRLPGIWHVTVIRKRRRLELYETCQCADVKWDVRGVGYGWCRAFRRCESNRRLQALLLRFRCVFHRGCPVVSGKPRMHFASGDPGGALATELCVQPPRHMPSG